MEVSLIDNEDKKLLKVTGNLYTFSPPKRLMVYYLGNLRKTKVIPAVALFQRFKYNFKYLEYAVFTSIYNEKCDRAMIIKVLNSCASNLRLVSFRNSPLNVSFVNALLTLAKNKSDKDRPLNIQVYRLYQSDFINTKNSIRRTGYIFSLVSRYCNDVFHTQVDVITNEILFRYFLTSADISSRKTKKNFVSLGACCEMPRKVFIKYRDIYPYVKVYNNPKNCYFNIVEEETQIFEDMTEDDFQH